MSSGANQTRRWASHIRPCSRRANSSSLELQEMKQEENWTSIRKLRILRPMPESITLYRVFLAAPSDVTDELVVVEGLLRDWSLQHGQELGVRVELVNWRTHTRPDTGKRPQALVNKQARRLRCRGCDLLVSLWNADGSSRIGHGGGNPARHQTTKTRARVFFQSSRTGTEACRAFPDREVQEAIWTEGPVWII